MKPVALALPILVLAGQAWAIVRHDVDRMSCASVQAVLKAEGAAILRYRSQRSGNTLYDRYVRDGSQCKRNQTAELARVPAADDSSCSVRKCAAKVSQR
jgi:hypothetical protein